MQTSRLNVRIIDDEEEHYFATSTKLQESF